jgi:thiol-disulfide isomerase/thioredoxin
MSQRETIAGSPEGTGHHDTIGAIALVLLLLAGLAGLSRAFRGAGGGAGAGRDAPDFTLPVVANASELGMPASLATPTVHLSDLRGRAVLIDFWATWCGPCRAEAPIIDRVSRRWKERGIVVVGVDTDRPEEGDPRAFARAHGLSYPIARDEAGIAQRAYEIDSLPTLVVVSKAGKIVAVRSGITDDGELERLISLAM